MPDPADYLHIPEGVRIALFRERVEENLKANAKFLNSAWKAILFLWLGIATLAISGYFGYVSLRNEVLVSRENNFQGRAAVCYTLLFDNDRFADGEETYEMPTFCMTGNVAQWYQRDVCDEFGNPPRCGESS